VSQYIIRRLILAIPSLIFVSFIIFSLLRLIPGDAVVARLAESGYVSPEDLAKMRAQLGLDRNFFVQYFDWASHAIRGDFGQSLWTSEAVLPSIIRRMGISLEIAVMAMSVAIMIAIPVGVLAAVKRNTWIDYTARLVQIAGLSIPDFWLATMLLLVLSLYIGWLPEFGWYIPWEDPVRNLQALMFPAMIVGYRFSAVSSRMTRSAMLEVMREDYVRTARAKGLKERTVIVRHALRNGLIPVITIMGSQLTNLLGGLVIIETVFSLDGLGVYALARTLATDFPAIQGTVVVMTAFSLLIYLLMDIVYAVLDPRVRYGGTR